MKVEMVDDGLETNMRAVVDNFDTLIINAIQRWIQETVLPQAKNDAPVKTGKLRNSLKLVSVTIRGEPKMFVVGWGNDAPYGRFQERGWRNVPPKKFVENALRNKFPQLENIWVFDVTQFVSQLSLSGTAATIKI